nr:hypothetical protein [uncultured Flavobacterium sp.]
MIAIQFSPIYEDRVSIYLKNSNLKTLGITYYFKDAPYGIEERNCFWLFTYKHSKQVNVILSALKELKEIMGVENLTFSYCYNEKEYYTQQPEIYGGPSICWFKV